MFDIFLKDDMNKLLKKKSIVFMGDSNIRALYKDFLCLLHQTQFISQHILRNKMEHTVFGDKLVFHGRQSNGRNYREEREATFNRTKVSFFFLTRVFDDYVKSVLKKLTYKLHPDVIIINCCLWDITRWGCDGVKKYKKNFKLLMKEFKKYVPDCLVIWITAPPIACDVKGGFLVKELQFLKYALRFHVVEANHYARKSSSGLVLIPLEADCVTGLMYVKSIRAHTLIVVENGFDVLDSHYHLKMQIHRRSNDGVHWLPPAIRYVTNLLLTHISLAWNVPLPHRYESVNLEKYLSLATEDDSIGANKSKKKEITKITFEDSSVANSCGKIQSARVEGNRNNSKSQGASPLCHKAKKNETIHAHMSRIQKEERLKRIRRWHQPNIGDSPTHGALHSSLQSVSANRYDSSSSINNEQMKQHEAILVDGSFQSSHYIFPTVINSNQIPLPPYNLDHNASCNFGSNSYYTPENFKFNFRNNVQNFGFVNNYNMQCLNFTNNFNQCFDFASNNNVAPLHFKENINTVSSGTKCLPVQHRRTVANKKNRFYI